MGLPTLLESFTSPRGLLMLRPSQRLRLTPPFSVVPTDIPMPVSMVDTAPMLPTPLPTDMPPMVPTPMPMARGLLMLSPRLMLRLTPPFSMVPTDTPMPVSMVDTEPMVPMVLPMEPTPIPT